MGRSQFRHMSSSNLIVQAYLERSNPSEQNNTSLTRTEVHRMRKPELAAQLQLRDMDTSGLKKDMVQRLLEVISKQEVVATLEDQELNNTSTETTMSNATIDLSQIDPSRTYILKVKGVSSLHSNGTGIGMVLTDAEDDRDVCTARKVLQGDRSVFEAEYSAIIIGIKFSIGRGVKKLILQLDHDVITNQLTGKYQVTRENLKTMYWSVMLFKEECLDQFSVELIKPAENAEAIELAQRGLATRKSQNIASTEDLNDPMEHSERRKPTSTLPPVDPGAPMAPMNYESAPIEPSKTYVLHFDGGARGNPGSAGAGMVLYQDGNEVWCGWKYLNKMSNNAAEYSSLITGLKCAVSLGVKRLRVFGDSDLIVKQVTGKYRVKDAKLKLLYRQVIETVPLFDHFEIHHFRREHNKRADWLANHAMDTETTYGYVESLQ